MTQELSQAIELLKVQSMDPRYDTVKKVRKSSQVDRQNWLEQISKEETKIMNKMGSWCQEER